MTDNYDDIINLPHHVSDRHPQMSMQARAAQFGSFAALTGRDTSALTDPKTMKKPHYDVVAAAIYRDGKFLCTQKGQTRYPYTTHKWEFPGGKIEVGESPQQALRRELIEEMDCHVDVGKHLITVNHEYPDFRITLTVYLCRLVSDTFTLKEHAAFQWLPREDLNSVDWVEADAEIARLVQNSESML